MNSVYKNGLTLYAQDTFLNTLNNMFCCDCYGLLVKIFVYKHGADQKGQPHVISEDRGAN